MTTNEDGWAQAMAATIRAERGAAGLSRLDMLNRTGLPRSTYYRIEEGQRGVSITQLRSIAAALDMSAGEMFDRADARAAEALARRDRESEDDDADDGDARHA